MNSKEERKNKKIQMEKTDEDNMKKYVWEFYNDLKLEISSKQAQLKNVKLRIIELSETMSQVDREDNSNHKLFSPKEQVKDKLDDLYSDEIDKLNFERANLEKRIELTNIKLEKMKCIIKVIDKKEVLPTDEKNEMANNGIKLLETQEMERKRIARDLHDSPVQNLTNVAHKIELCTKLLDIDTIRAKLELQTTINTIHTTINDMRSIIYNLRPMSIDDLGLVVTVERYIKKVMMENENISLKLKVENNEIMTIPVINLTLFRIIQEACSNTIKHTKASNIIIIIKYELENIELVVKDDGEGFDYESKNQNAEVIKNFGFSIMKERVYLLSGNMEIHSKIGEGTEIKVKVPIEMYKEEKDVTGKDCDSR